MNNFDIERDPFVEFPELKLTGLQSKKGLDKTYVWVVLLTHHPKSPLRNKPRKERRDVAKNKVLSNTKPYDATLHEEVEREYKKLFGDDPLGDTRDVLLGVIQKQNRFLEETDVTLETSKGIAEVTIKLKAIVSDFIEIEKMLDEVVEQKMKGWGSTKPSKLTESFTK